MPATSAGSRSVRVTLTANVSDYIAKLAAAGAQTEKLVTSTNKMSSREAWDKASTGLLAFGAIAVGAAGAAIAKFSEFDQAMSNVRSTGEDARANIDGLTDSAMKWGAETKYSATEAAGGIESLLKAGVSATDVIGGGLEGALSLAATGNLNVADSAEVAAIAMTQFGLSGADIPHIADLIAAGAGKAQGDVSDMALALKQSGLVASQFGLSIEETTGSLAAFASAGLIGSDAGTSLKTMLLALANPSSKAKTTMDELGIAAYDASGNFVGITNLAGQLKDKLSALPQAQRDAALATIFGNDAIRAANVLYTQGSEGIQDWINQVNDAGYAAEAAAIRQDNLAGDLEKLGGAFDTLLTKAGEASAGGLRSVVQDLTGFVDMLSRHGDAAGTLVSLAGAAGGISLAAGMAMKGVAAFVDFKRAAEELNIPLGKVGKAGLTVAADLAAVAAIMAVAQAAGSSYQAQMDGHILSSDKMVRSLERLAETGEYTLAMNLSLASSQRQASTSGMDMQDMFARLTTSGGGFLETVETATSHMFGLTGTLEGSRDALKQVDQALSSMDTAKAGAAFARIREDAEGVGVGMDELLNYFPEYRSQLEATAQSVGVYHLSQQEMLDWMSGTVPESVLAGQALAALGIAHVDAAADAATQTAALQSLMDMQNQMAQAALGASSAETSYASALLNAGDAAAAGGYSIDEATGKIDLHTKAGIQAQSALDNLAAAALNNRDAMKENGASMEELQAATQSARDDFVAVAEQMGLSADAANALADKYGLIPGQVVTDVSTTGADVSQAQIDAVKAKIDELPPEMQTMIRSAWDDAAYSVAQASIAGLPPETQAMIMSAWNSGGYDSAVASLADVDPETRAAIISAWDAAGYKAATSALASIQNKTVYIDTVYRSLDQRVAYNIGQPGRAGGGPIFGPGTSTSDDILARLSNGEFVTRTWAAERIGYDRLAYMNATGELPKFRDGGPAQIPSASWQQPSVPTTQQTQVINSGGGNYLTRADLDGLGIKILDPGIGMAIAAEIVLTAKRV